MIADAAVLQNVRDEWAIVRKTWDMMSANIKWAFARGGYTSPTFRSAAYSLTLLFAFTVLEHVLQQLCKEEYFDCKSQNVGPLMNKSQSSLVWIDYQLVDEARKRRNDIAHHQIWIQTADCKRYLDAIETELRGWKILI